MFAIIKHLKNLILKIWILESWKVNQNITNLSAFFRLQQHLSSENLKSFILVPVLKPGLKHLIYLNTTFQEIVREMDLGMKEDPSRKKPKTKRNPPRSKEEIEPWNRAKKTLAEKKQLNKIMKEKRFEKIKELKEEKKELNLKIKKEWKGELKTQAIEKVLLIDTKLDELLSENNA